MKLWYSPPSPFARKVRAAAMELGLSSRIDPVEIAVAPTQANPEFGRENPLMKVPALGTDEWHWTHVASPLLITIRPLQMPAPNNGCK